MKLAICNEMFEDWQIEDVFLCAAKLGYDAVELAPFTLAESVVDISQTERDRIRKGSGRQQRSKSLDSTGCWSRQKGCTSTTPTEKSARKHATIFSR